MAVQGHFYAHLSYLGFVLAGLGDVLLAHPYKRFKLVRALANTQKNRNTIRRLLASGGSAFDKACLAKKRERVSTEQIGSHCGLAF